MKNALRWLVLIGVLAFTAAVLIWQWTSMSQPHPPAAPTAAAPQAPAIQPAPAPSHYPIPNISSEAPNSPASLALPALADSDRVFLEALGRLWNQKSIAALFYPERVIGHLVAAIDNLPRKRLSVQIRPVKPAGGQFLTKGEGQNLVIAPGNAARYQSYVQLVETLDAKQLAAVYVRYYPLFQQAYADLGYPDGYFNDRLIAVIDHLLEAPEDQEPVHLAQPHVAYEYVDQALEASSAGHKLLLRIDSDNAIKIKAKLREIRVELTRQHAK